MAYGGLANEFALITLSVKYLNFKVNTKDSEYLKRKAHFRKCSVTTKALCYYGALAGILTMAELDSRIRTIKGNDIRGILISSDINGSSGDPTDYKYWMGNSDIIGVSAKVSNDFTKHPRLSATYDFKQSWGISTTPCSDKYFEAIRPAFDQLLHWKNAGLLWKDDEPILERQRIYKTIQSAFISELETLSSQEIQNLVSYSIGDQDYYKVLRHGTTTDVHALNFRGTLPTPKLDLSFSDISIVKKKVDSVILKLGALDLVFRIHSADTEVIPSMKIEISADIQQDTLVKQVPFKTDKYNKSNSEELLCM